MKRSRNNRNGRAMALRPKKRFKLEYGRLSIDKTKDLLILLSEIEQKNRKKIDVLVDIFS
jgi:hypothetical protein